MNYDKTLTSPQKALAINLNDRIYGTFAEIGAGQEVARQFFLAGGAAGTIAKSMSAYDMAISDSIYGKEASGRYVCEDRLHNMLNYEYAQLLERLEKLRPENNFFVFANTVAAKSYRSKRDGHGWLGIKFRHTANAAPSQAVVHVNLKDKENFQQQEALGTIGVNLIYACFHYVTASKTFVDSLMDNMTPDRLEIDMIRVSGPAFEGVDSRLLCVELVRKGLCQAVLFDEQGDVHQAADALYKKNILICRGSFRPPTLLNVDMLEQGLVQLKASLEPAEREKILSLAEISMNKLVERGGQMDSEDFLARVDLLAELKQPVLVSNFSYFSGLANYLNKQSVKQMNFVVGLHNLPEIFDEKKYADSRAGILAGFGELMGAQNHLYVYPALSEDANIQPPKVLSLEDFKCPPELELLFQYLKQRKYIVPLQNYNPAVLPIWSRVVLKMIQSNHAGWEAMVPKQIVKKVKDRCLFGVYCPDGPMDND